MPRPATIERAKKAKRQGKSPSTQAGEFVREVIHDIREGKHGARSAKQAIAIGLSKARRAGVKLPPPEKGEASEGTRASAKRDLERGQSGGAKQKPSAKRSRATLRSLKKEGAAAASHEALSKQAHKSSRKRTPQERSAAAKKAAATKGPQKRKEAAKKAVHTKGHAGLVKAARKAAKTREVNAK